MGLYNATDVTYVSDGVGRETKSNNLGVLDMMPARQVGEFVSMMRVKERQTRATERSAYVPGVNRLAVGGSDRSSVVGKVTFIVSGAQVSLIIANSRRTRFGNHYPISPRLWTLIHLEFFAGLPMDALGPWC
jgi:hypothetical protein